MIISLTIKGEEQELPCSEVLELYPPKRNRDICEDEDVIKNTCCPMCHAAERNTEYGWHNLKKNTSNRYNHLAYSFRSLVFVGHC